MTVGTLDPWLAVVAARVPEHRLDALAPVRDRPDVLIVREGAIAWVRWAASHADVIRCLLPVPDVELFTTRDGHWFRFGRRVPASDRPPQGDARPLAGLVVPDRIEPISPPTSRTDPMRLSIARSSVHQAVTALACEIADLRNWSDSATTAELRSVRGAITGIRVLLRGKSLPFVPSATRYWGDTLLVPIGFRPDPDLPAQLIHAAVQAAEHELVVFGPNGADIVPTSAFEPLTRAGLRLAMIGGET